jgi:hypothetical protein
MLLLVVGTYEKQLVRNSLFALIFCPLLFYIWWHVRYRQRVFLIWLYPIIIGLWGCFHGSYLLGFGLLALILFGDVLDSLLGKLSLSRKNLLQYFTVLSLSFFLISVANPRTASYYNLNWFKTIFSVSKSGSGDDASNGERKRQNSVSEIIGSNEAAFFSSLKVGLNNTLFKTNRKAGFSADFSSPFDNLYRPFVWICLLFGIVAWIMLCFMIRPLRFSSLLPLFAVSIFGCGYLRIIGYIPIVAGAVLFIALSQGEIKTGRLVQKLSGIELGGAFVAGLLIVAVYLDLVFGFPVSFSTRLHVFGVGRIPIYSEKCADILLEDSFVHNVFTTRNNGGYLLLRWFPQKKVFNVCLTGPSDAIESDSLGMS